MWIRKHELIYPVAILKKDARQAGEWMYCLRREALAAQLYLFEKPDLPSDEWTERIEDLGMDALNYCELIRDVVDQLTDERGRANEAPLIQDGEDLHGYLDRCMDIEEELLTAYQKILTETADADITEIAQYLSERTECHVRRLCRMMCLANGAPSDEADAMLFDMEGCSEEIEYYTDDESGRLCCKSKGRIVRR